MKSAVVALFAGLLFGVGLLMAGMANPAKVLAFLDVFGVWDPSLALVMGAAIPVAACGFWLSRRRSGPFVEATFHWPTRKELSPSLLLGSACFGVGWGLVGLCPGPALLLLGVFEAKALVFVLCMAVGVILANWLTKRLPARLA